MSNDRFSWSYALPAACLVFAAACATEPNQADPSGPSLQTASVGAVEECGACVLGPLLFVRAKDTPVTERNTFVGDPGLEYRIILDDLGSQGADGSVVLNGEVLMAPRQADETGPRRVEVIKALPSANVLEVRLTGKPGSQLRVTIEAGREVDETGGTIALQGGQVALDLPAGAAGGPLFITAAPYSGPFPTGATPVGGAAWDLGPDGTTFAHPVTLTFHYDPAAIPAGVPEAELRIHKVVNGTFVQQNAGVVDVVNHTVSAEINGFSVYVLIRRQFPGSVEDLQAPVLRSIEMLDPVTGTWGAAPMLDVSGGDLVLKTRLTMTDDISGVNEIYLTYVSPTGRQYRYPCYNSGFIPPQSGSDTNGDWECESNWPQYSESGAWQVSGLSVRDKVRNYAYYFSSPSGFCNGSLCVPAVPAVTVVANPTDITAPSLVGALEVGLGGVTPPMFASQVSVDVATSSRNITFQFAATDDLSGVSYLWQATPQVAFLGTYLYVTSPSGSAYFYAYCYDLTQGTPLDGTWQCAATVPQSAETGSWNVQFFVIRDRVGNQAVFNANGSGQLCLNGGGMCVQAPVVDVTSLGDNQGPLIQAMTLSSTNADATVALDLTDDLSGFSFGWVTFSSTTSSQYEQCYLPAPGGPSTTVSTTCTVTFSQYAARGQWVMSLYLYDLAGNVRSYFRRAADGYLCYRDAQGQDVCQDFGDSDVVLR
jgi:hypothetical protein